MMGSTSSAVLDKTCDLATKGHLSDRLFRICARIGTNSKTILTYRMKWSSICPSYGKHRKSLSMRHSNAKWLIYIYIQNWSKIAISHRNCLCFLMFFFLGGGGGHPATCHHARGREMVSKCHQMLGVSHAGITTLSSFLRSGSGRAGVGLYLYS